MKRLTRVVRGCLRQAEDVPRVEHPTGQLSVRRLSVSAIFVALSLAALALTASASAHFDSGQYSHNSSGCNSPVNPVSMVFYNQGTADNAIYHVYHHSGWDGTVIEQGQYFASIYHLVCRFQNGASADGYVFETRHHVRFRQSYDADGTFGITTVGTPHFEKKVGCGHAVYPTSNGVSGFDTARRDLGDSMGAGGHNTWYVGWGNTQNFTQCNGWIAASNGNVRYVEILG